MAVTRNSISSCPLGPGSSFCLIAIAKLANDLRVNVPKAVAKSSQGDWTKLLDATIDRAKKLAAAAEDPEKAEGPKVNQAYRDLTETCLVCHTAFGVKSR